MKNLQKQQSISDDKARSNKIQITLVSEEERNTYRVPSYGYLLP